MSEEVKNEFTFENPEYRQTYWHTCSHVMAQGDYYNNIVYSYSNKSELNQNKLE